MLTLNIIEGLHLNGDRTLIDMRVSYFKSGRARRANLPR
jgi:hypothetical protein